MGEKGEKSRLSGRKVPSKREKSPVMRFLQKGENSLFFSRKCAKFPVNKQKFPVKKEKIPVKKGECFYCLPFILILFFMFVIMLWRRFYYD